MVIYGVLLNFNFAIAFNMGKYYAKLFYLGDNVENPEIFESSFEPFVYKIDMYKTYFWKCLNTVSSYHFVDDFLLHCSSLMMGIDGFKKEQGLI